MVRGSVLGRWMVWHSVLLIIAGVLPMTWGSTAAALPAGVMAPQDTSSTAPAWPSRIQPAADTAPPQATAAAPLAVRGVTVIDVARGRHLADQTVVIVGTRIRTLGPMAKIKVPRGAQVVDGRGKYLIPGLWDMHVHAWGATNPYRPFIAYGITGVREMGTPIPLDELHRYRQEVAAGTRIGARFVASGQYLSTVNVDAHDVVGARRIVDSLQGAGADFIKLHLTDTSVTPAVVFALLAEARKVGIPVVGHQPPSVSLTDAADSGQRTFEHTAYIYTPCWKTDSASERACAAEMAHLVRHKSWVTPTILGLLDTLPRKPGWEATYVPDSSAVGYHAARQDGLWLVRKLHRLGIGFLAASDVITGGSPPPDFPDSLFHGPDSLFFNPGAGLHHELAYLVEAGLTPLEALQAATLNPAKYLEATDSLGTVAPNKLADLVLLDADPLEDIYNARRVRAVVANGRYFDRAALDGIIADARGKRRAPARGTP